MDNPADVNQQLQIQKAVLSKVWEVMDRPDLPQDSNLLQLLHLAGVPLHLYVNALKLSRSGKHVVLKREYGERWVNNYNPAILKAWRGNMDLQFITDPYSCIVYITSYMLKSERAMSELLRKVAKETSHDEVREQLRKLGSAFLNHREISAQEAAYRLLSLPLKQATRTVTFINTTPKEKRVSMMKPLSVILAMESDDEDVYCHNMVDRYSARPQHLENLCLAEFVANYTTDRKDSGAEENDEPSILDEEHLPQKITLQRDMGSMHKRRREAVIRFYKDKEHGEEFYRNLLMLYKPWQNEDTDLRHDAMSFQESYHLVEDTVEANRKKYTQNAEAVDQAMADLDRNGPPEHIWDQIAPGMQQQQADQNEEGHAEERGTDQEGVTGNVDLEDDMSTQERGELHARYDTELNKNTMTRDDYTRMMRSLNTKQKAFIMYHRKWCKDMVLALKSGKPFEPYRVFLSGPGGVGKSHVIKLVHYETARLFRCLGGMFEPGDLPVILTAFTGTAAFNVDGMTLHSAFSLPIGKKQYCPLNNEKLNTIRSRLGKLRLLIIDEVSMVGADTLFHIHRRLEDLMQTSQSDTCFGGVGILAVGDLFQLQPVRQAHVFDLPSDAYAKLYGSLWQENFQLMELTEIMRQKDDLAFAELLGRVRTASCNDQDIKTLKTREIHRDDPAYPSDALHVFKTNAQVCTTVLPAILVTPSS